MCGANDARWTQHEFADKVSPRTRNVRCILARTEYQTGNRLPQEVRQHYHGRDMVHWHILIWLRNVQRTFLHHVVSGDLHPRNADLRYCVHRYQKSHAPSLEIQEGRSHTEGSHNACTAHFRYPLESSDVGLRMYCKRTLQILRSHMDVQVIHSYNDAAAYLSK